VETDFWPNLLHYLKAQGSAIALVNGKMSERSARRHRVFPAFGRRLLGYFDLIALQASDYRDSFAALTDRPLHITGNLKLDQMPRERGDGLREQWGLQKRVVVIGSTHRGEEELLLSQLKSLTDIQIVLAPRHPERFSEVENLLKALGIRYGRVSQRELCHELLLVDVMGELTTFYSMADAALVGGSFVTGVGGHNIFEPMAFGVPTLFGPYMHNQKEMCALALKAKAAFQVPGNEILSALLDEVKLAQRGENGRALFLNSRGATEKTFALLRPFLDN
jgi:3-deoxy-D-manno-octulosonic-acid transferase